jgi:hypothetical protein
MPMLAVAAVGAWIGSAAITGTVMGVSGAAIGWAVGSVVGSMLFAPDGPKAKLQESRAAKLQFGAKIQRVRGRMRLPLSPRWTSDAHNNNGWRATSQEAGGKGGGGSEYYTYSADGLFWCCAGLDGATGVRLWNNGKLVWSSLADSDDASLIASSETPLFSAIAFHDGNAAQMPWPVYEAAVGTADADAHRGLFCVSIENYQAGQSPQWGFLEVEFVEAYTEDVLPIDHGTYLGSTSGIGYALSMPPGVGPGDSLVAYIVHRNTAVNPVFTDGWSGGPIDHSQAGGDSIRLHFFTRTATGDINDDLADFTVAADGGEGAWWVVVAFRGQVDPLWPSSFGGGVGAGDYNRNQEGQMDPGQVTKPSGFQFIMAVGFLVSPIGGAEIGAPPSGYTMAGQIGSTVVFGGDPTEFNVQLGVAFSEYIGTVGNPPAFDDGNGSYGGGGSGTLTFAITWGTTVPVITPLTVDLKDVVDGEMVRCLDSSKFDNSELEGIPVTGWVFNSSARQSCEELAAGYYFGATCRDQLFTRLRGAASVATIVNADTGAGVGQPGEVFTGPDRNNDLEIGAQWTVTGIDHADYEAGTESSPRVATNAVKVEQVTLNGVFTPQELKGRAQAYAQDARVGAHPFALALDDSYAQLEPFDVITAFDEEGNSHRGRLVAESYAQCVHAFQGVRDDQGALPTTAPTSSNYEPTTTVAAIGDSVLLLLDIPILRDVDNDAGFYEVGYAASGSFQGMEVLESLDGTTYTNLGAITQAATAGVTEDVLADCASPRFIDHASRVTVTTNKALASYGFDAVLAGTPPAYLIGDEIVYAMTATLVSGLTFTLSNFLRGLKGTEWATGTHEAGERFVVLQPVGIRRGAREAGELDVEYQFKGRTLGQPLSAVDAQAFTDTGIGLKPYAPVDAKATRDGSGGIGITWNRRSRLSTPATYTTQPPLGEATEAYVVQVMASSAFATVTREISATAANCTYTLAQQEADFGSARTTLYLRIRQVSAIVGNGYAIDSTVSVGEATYFTPLASNSYPDVRLASGSYALITRNATASMGLYRYVDGATTLELIATTSANNNFRYMQALHLSTVDAATGDWVMYLRGYTNPAGVRKLMRGNLPAGSAATVVPAFMTANPPFALGFISGTFIALCNDGTVYHSVDSGANWTNEGSLSGFTAPGAPSSFASGRMMVVSGRLVLLYGGLLYFCTAGDGLVWSAATGDVVSAPATYTSSFFVGGIDTLGSVGCCAARGEVSGVFTSLIYTTTDGEDWTEAISELGTAGASAYDIQLQNGGCLAFGDAFYCTFNPQVPDPGRSNIATLGVFDGKTVYSPQLGVRCTDSRMLMWSATLGDPIVASIDGDTFTETIAWP